MKKLIYKVAVLITAALLLFSGCTAAADTKDAQAAAKKLVESLYTVNTAEVETLNNINNTNPENDGTDSIEKAEDAAAALTEKLNSKFKTITTDKEYNLMVRDTTFARIVEPASKLKCQLSPSEITLDGESKVGDSYKYNYTVKLTLETAAGEKEIATESGIVQVEQVDGVWLANFISRIKTSDLLTK